MEVHISHLPNQAPQARSPAPLTARSSPLVIAGRMLLLLFAAGAAVSAFLLTGEDAGSDPAAQYACPMHRDSTASAPGECPICGMALRRLGVGGSAPFASIDALARGQPDLVEVVRRRVFTHTLHAPAWLERPRMVRALLYDDEIKTLTPAEPALFYPTGPGPRVDVRLATGLATPWDASTSLIEFHVEGVDPKLPIGTAGWVELANRPRSALVVPSSSILQVNEETYVLTVSGDGRAFAKRPVHIGKTVFGLTTVVSGLYERERVAARSVFFLDAERKLAASMASTGAVAP